MTVAFQPDGTFNVYFHGKEKEIALALRSCEELDNVIQEYNMLKYTKF